MHIMIIAALMVAATLSMSGQPVELVPLEFNSAGDEFAPSLALNGRSMIVTVDERRISNELHGVERTPSGWGHVTDVFDELQISDQSGCATMTPDGQFMVFAATEAAGTIGRTDLYSARRVDGAWSQVSNLGATLNSSAWDSHPTLSSDGRTLIFASDRDGGSGGVDLWMSHLGPGGWSAPTPLREANGPGNELAPRLAADNVTLFFASDRPGGAGGFDIYTLRLDDRAVTGIRNLGAPINSPADELFYTVQPHSTQAYVASSRAGGAGGLDLYMVVPNPFPGDELVTVIGRVRDAATSLPLGADIVLTDLTTGREIARLRSDDRTGEYTAHLTAGHRYSVTATKKGYVFHSSRYDVPPRAPGRITSNDIDLTPLSGGSTRLLVFFDFDSDRLNDESRPELERLVALLREEGSVRILLEGHTDDVGSDEYNDDLSQRRAAAVRSYLASAGIDATRIKTTGLGKRSPLVDGTTDEARANNRRVEMKVLPD